MIETEPTIFVVQYSYDYEGDEIEWVGTSWEEAVREANVLQSGDRVTISAWRHGERVEGWTRPSSYWSGVNHTKQIYKHYKAPNAYYHGGIDVELGQDEDA